MTKPITPLIAKNLDTGEERVIDIDPRVYMSVTDWKPVPPNEFAAMLHGYTTRDENRTDHGTGLMSTKVFRLDHMTMAVIHYSKKEEGSAVSVPVLMTINSHGGAANRLVCFASLRYGPSPNA